MRFIENQLYHIYNRGNQKQEIFRSRENYLYFVEKLRIHLLPRCDLLAWCLMPNHFHLMVNTTPESIAIIDKPNLPIQSLSEGIRLMLTSYTKGFNNAFRLSGSLFQQKTKSKMLTGENPNYPLSVFYYVHQNPMTAGLVNKMEDWEFSSFNEYIKMTPGPLCNKAVAYQLLGLNEKHFYRDSYLARGIPI